MVAGVLAVVAVVVVGLPSPRRWWSGPPHGEVVGAPPLVVVGGGPAVVMVVGPEVEGGPWGCGGGDRWVRGDTLAQGTKGTGIREQGDGGTRPGPLINAGPCTRHTPPLSPLTPSQPACRRGCPLGAPGAWAPPTPPYLTGVPPWEGEGRGARTTPGGGGRGRRLRPPLHTPTITPPRRAGGAHLPASRPSRPPLAFVAS